MDTNDLCTIDNFFYKNSLTVEKFIHCSPYQSKACFVYCYITKSKHLCKANILTTKLFFPFLQFCFEIFLHFMKACMFSLLLVLFLSDSSPSEHWSKVTYLWQYTHMWCSEDIEFCLTHPNTKHQCLTILNKFVQLKICLGLWTFFEKKAPKKPTVYFILSEGECLYMYMCEKIMLLLKNS